MFVTALRTVYAAMGTSVGHSLVIFDLNIRIRYYEKMII